VTRILGISAFYHDSAACLIEDGRIKAALHEERFSRKKHDSAFPEKAIATCLAMAACRIEDVDHVVFYEKPFLKFERLLQTYILHCPRGVRSYLKAIPLWIKEKLWIKDTIARNLGCSCDILFAEHHESHAAAAFYPSPFHSAAILTMDGVGEFATSTRGRGFGNTIELTHEIHFPDSLGLLYSTLTYYLGFEVNSGEYKVMGLAPYGVPRYVSLIKDRLIEIHDDGSFLLNSKYFDYETGLTMASSRLNTLFEGPPRKPSETLTQRHKDIAASIQKVTEEVMLNACRWIRQETAEKHLCLAGGVALNCVANGRILREAGFEDIWIQPAAGDAGGALGAALAAWYGLPGNERKPGEGWNLQRGSLLGNEYSPSQIKGCLDSYGAAYVELDRASLLDRTAQAIADGAVVGWFQGPMEFGPRALGCRSILGDPRRAAMHQIINGRIKFRESFRPFAPAVLEEKVSEYFELDRPSPYMLLVSAVRQDKRAQIPAVTHVDGSARIQTVNDRDNPKFYELLRTFHKTTGCPVLINTSFNVRGEPIVESPAHAFECFMRTFMDVLVVGDCYLDKRDQKTGLAG
jgi:carbamoyltransferase